MPTPPPARADGTKDPPPLSGALQIGRHEDRPPLSGALEIGRHGATIVRHDDRPQPLAGDRNMRHECECGAETRASALEALRVR